MNFEVKNWFYTITKFDLFCNKCLARDFSQKRETFLALLCSE